MNTNNKISIKVKSKTEQRIMNSDVEMITEWNFKRIFIALISILLVIIIPAYYFNSSEKPLPPKSKTLPDVSIDTANFNINKEPNKISILPVPVKVIAVENEPKKEIMALAKKQPITKPQVKVVSTQQKVSANISRATLAKNIINLEPSGHINLPFIVTADKAEGFYYFTEIKNMQDKVIFHEWLYQGKSKYKRKFLIRGNRWRTSTSKLFNMGSIGEWQVRAVSQQGNILHEINFMVKEK